jgi:uncharacterized protein with HEPN domain
MTNTTLDQRLDHILDATARIKRNMVGVEFKAFDANVEQQWIVQHGLLIVSEAVRHIPDDLLDQHAQIPWKQIKSIGNRIRHEYQRLDIYLIWTIATVHIVPLHDAVAAIKTEVAQRPLPQS